ncbi:XRE family transcriptional regulator [Bosea sp. MMO-172]|uniref:XRE family transcriptional regulator n=1 Tax=Bosea sp. MMO-172 TaxID=3127885 RepID=UPI00301A9AE3
MSREGDRTANGFDGLEEGCMAHSHEQKHVLEMKASDTFIAAAKAESKVQLMTNDLAEMLRLTRRRLKIPMTAVAKAVGVSTAAVQQWETGVTRPSVENLLLASQFLHLDADYMMGLYTRQFGREAISSPPQSPAAEEIPVKETAPPNAIFEPEAPELPNLGGARDIEELGIAVGGDGEDDGAFEFNGQVIDRVTRPPGIKNRTNVFALRVANSSMFPKFEDGERIYAERRRPAIGDYVVVELLPQEEGRAGKGYIKKLVSMNSGRVVVEQFNPPKTIEFSRDAVKDVHRVIPWPELLGI